MLQVIGLMSGTSMDPSVPRLEREVTQLRGRLGARVRAAEELGWAGGAIEAQAFAYLAVRSLRGLAIETRLYAGLEGALQRLAANGIAWGVVTNKPGWLTEPLLERLHLRQRAAVVVSGDTLKARKPDPAPLLCAAERLGLAPAQCIYIGDAERDVLAARAAGMPVYVALFGYIPAQERPREWPANGWLDTPRAVAELLDGLPRPA
jgi:2-phosphoglycolate phosphatase